MSTTTDTTTSSDAKSHFHFNQALFEEQIQRQAETYLDQFRSITRTYALFHIGYLSLGFLEIFLFVVFFSFFAKSALLAFSIAAMFLTGFSYFVLRFYFQAKKPEQFYLLLHGFRNGCMSVIPFEKASSEHSSLLSFAFYRFIALLQGQENQYYKLPRHFETISPLLEKFSIWNHWKDVHQMKEMLHFSLIHENINLVKQQPTDLEAHVALAKAYLALSKLYMDPAKSGNEQKAVWIPPEYSSPEMQNKFKSASERAIEEFKILDDYAPNDPWVHAQLASIYHDINRPEEEILEYEIMLKISPHDKEILFRLGVLYFQQGRNAKGLRIYEILKNSQDKRVEELILFYDAYTTKEYSLL